MNSLRIPRVPATHQRGRRGIVLILSLGMLTLFTIVAITLASISRTQSTAAANFKRAEQYGRQNAGVRPEQVEDLFRYAVNQLIYDTRNPQSAVRGHSLLRDMYGSPDTYDAVRATAGTPPATILVPTLLSEVEGNGAELRLRKDDLKGLLGIAQNASTDNDPRLLYQGVYNGTGVPLPTKLDTSWLGTAPTIAQTQLTPAEIALQFAFPRMPLSLVPYGKTTLPSGSGSLFQAMGSYPTPTLVGTNIGYWFPRFTLNYTVFDRLIGGQVATVQRFRQETSTYPDGSMIMPEKFFFGTNITAIPGPGRNAGHHWFGADEDYDYPDINNMFLALERADGRTLIPSFHRPGIIGQVAAGLIPLAAADGTTITPPARMTNVNQIPWLRTDEMIQGNIPTDIRALVLRPRASDYDPATLGIASPRAGRFKEMADSFTRPTPTGPIVPGQDGLPDDLDGSGFVGDHPSELDVDTDGDGLNDAIWIDLGYKPVQIGDAIIKPLFAFKVIDLDGKLNLNVHGNMHRPFALNGAAATENFTPGQHSSHLGASVTEINPMHGLIIGDISTDDNTTSNLIAPARPEWFFDRTTKPVPGALSVPLNQLAGNPAGYPHPYQRVIEGFTDAAGNYHPGRWSSTTRDASLRPTPGRPNKDDNWNFSPFSPTPPLTVDYGTLDYFTQGTPVPAETQAQNRVRSLMSSVGDGRPVIGTAGTPPTIPLGIPASASPLSPLDATGMGRTLSPFSRLALGLSNGRTRSNLRWDGGNLLPLVINHPVTMSPQLLSPFGSYVPPNQISSWGINTSLAFTGGFPTLADGMLNAELFTFDEALEVNPYNPLENDDFFYSATDLAALWRAGDIDGPSSASRLTSILSSQVVSPTTDISAASTALTPPGYTQIEYARKRQQRMFTHASWDLNRFSAPPNVGLASLGTLWGGAVPSGVKDVVESLLQSTTPPVPGDAMLALQRKHSAGAVPSILTNQLTYMLPTAAGAQLLPIVPAFGANTTYPGGLENGRRAMETLATRRTIDGRDFLIPYEVQMGRRFDLNRPMRAYGLQNTLTHGKLLRLPGVGQSTATGLPEDTLSGVDTTIDPVLVDRERESMAQQIYVLLSIAAGLVGDNNPNVSGSNVPLIDTKMRVAQARVLAQIAVNIVDYMDPDSVMTQMVFDPYLADGWGDNSDTTSQFNLTTLPAFPRRADGTPDPTFGTPSPDQWRAACTVIGFELPELVVNETISVVQENYVKDTANPMADAVRSEVLNTWVELMNPWPGMVDPVSPLEVNNGQPVRGIRLTDPAVGGQSRFMVGITCTAGGINPLKPTTSIGGSNETTYQSFVRFSNTGIGAGSDGVLRSSTAGVDVYVPSRDGATRQPNPDFLKTGDYGYFVIGPGTPAEIAAATWNGAPPLNKQTGYGDSNVLDAAVWDGLPGTQDYASTACGQPLPSPTTAAAKEQMVVEVKLYRVRNPFALWDEITNPYVVIDTVRLDAADRKIVQDNAKRGTNGDLDNVTAVTAIAGRPGVYFSEESNTADIPTSQQTNRVVPTWGGNTVASDRLSWQRRQPWHGWNAEWDPYQVNSAAGHPLVSASSPLSSRPMNLEGLYLGLPSLAWSRNTTELNNINSLWQNGFIPLRPSLKSTFDQYGPNAPGDAASDPAEVVKPSLRRTDPSNAANNPLNLTVKTIERWQTIPFANRQLATPLELLNVRLYGSHLSEPTAGIFEWRQRFTDDFEFMTQGVPVVDGSGTLGTTAYFERTWRSRQIPWFTSDRVTHPTWGNAPGTFNLTGYDPTPSGLGTTLASRSQLQLPLGNLYRFFEFVECRSRLNNGRRPEEQHYVDALPQPAGMPTGTGGPVLFSRRQDRVPGKINLNTITEEEVIKGLIDSVATMFFDATEYVTMLNGFRTNGTPLTGPTGSVTNYWPIGYWQGLFTPLGQYPLSNPGAGETLDLMGDLIGWDELVRVTVNNVASANSLLTPPNGAAPTSPRLMMNGTMQMLLVSGSAPFDPAVPLISYAERQWPGVAVGLPVTGSYFPYPGTDVNYQVSSEMYRAFLLSRAGADGVTGTADDRPFRSFAAANVEDTILRSRSPQTTGIYDPPTITINMTNGAVVPEASEVDIATSHTWMDGASDVTTGTIDVGGTPFTVALGTSIIRLGGQVSPRLFDPVPNPYMDNPAVADGRGADFLLFVGADRELSLNQDTAKLKYQRPDIDTVSGLPKTVPVDYWMLDEKRNSILAKIGGNTTTRSHVFAVWVTVGFFRVEPGTENLKVPLLGAEVGSETGRAKRHRAFFVIDRSQATEYEPGDIDANFDLDRLRNRRVLEYYKIIE